MVVPAKKTHWIDIELEFQSDWSSDLEVRTGRHEKTRTYYWNYINSH